MLAFNKFAVIFALPIVLSAAWLSSDANAKVCVIDAIPPNRAANCTLQNRITTFKGQSEFEVSVWIKNTNESGPVGEVIAIRRSVAARGSGGEVALRFDIFDTFDGGIFREGDISPFIQLLSFGGRGYNLTLLKIEDAQLVKLGEFSSRQMPRVIHRDGKSFLRVRKEVDQPEVSVELR